MLRESCHYCYIIKIDGIVFHRQSLLFSGRNFKQSSMFAPVFVSNLGQFDEIVIKLAANINQTKNSHFCIDFTHQSLLKLESQCCQSRLFFSFSWNTYINNVNQISRNHVLVFLPFLQVFTTGSNHQEKYCKWFILWSSLTLTTLLYNDH